MCECRCDGHVHVQRVKKHVRKTFRIVWLSVQNRDAYPCTKMAFVAEQQLQKLLDATRSYKADRRWSTKTSLTRMVSVNTAVPQRLNQWRYFNVDRHQTMVGVPERHGGMTVVRLRRDHQP